MKASKRSRYKEDNLEKFHVHVLIAQTNAEPDLTNLDNALTQNLIVSAYQKNEWIQEIKAELSKLRCKTVQFHNVTLDNYVTLFDGCTEEEKKHIVVLNLCDGSEEDSFPGICVIRHLQKLGIAYSGADHRFYSNSTVKVSMKALFDAHDVMHAPWCSHVTDTEECRASLEQLKFPLLCKPDPSYDCCGITEKSLVWSSDEAVKVAAEVHTQGFSRVYAEEFISGREFTCFVFGDASYGLETSAAIERVFDPALPKLRRFMIHDPEGVAQPSMRIAPENVQARCRDAAKQAYVAVQGCGYGRVDLRMDETTGEVKVLEVNAAPGLGVDPETCLFGLFLDYAKATYAEYVAKFLLYALYRRNAECDDRLSESYFK